MRSTASCMGLEGGIRAVCGISLAALPALPYNPSKNARPRPAILWHLLTRPRHFAAPRTSPKPSSSAGCLDDWRAGASVSGRERGLHLLTLLRFLPRLYGFVTPDMGLTLVIVDQFLGSWLERLSACTEKALRWVSTRPCPNVTSTVGFERDGSLDSWLDRLFIRSSMWDISRTIRVVVFAFRRGCGSEQRLYALPIGSLCGLSLVTFVKRAEKRGPQWMEIRGTCPRNLAAYWCFAAA